MTDPNQPTDPYCSECQGAGRVIYAGTSDAVACSLCGGSGNNPDFAGQANTKRRAGRPKGSPNKSTVPRGRKTPTRAITMDDERYQYALSQPGGASEFLRGLIDLHRTDLLIVD